MRVPEALEADDWEDEDEEPEAFEPAPLKSDAPSQIGGMDLAEPGENEAVFNLTPAGESSQALEADWVDEPASEADWVDEEPAAAVEAVAMPEVRGEHAAREELLDYDALTMLHEQGKPKPKVGPESEVAYLANKLGVPADVVAQNVEPFRHRAEMMDFDPRKVDPDIAALALRAKLPLVTHDPELSTWQKTFNSLLVLGEWADELAEPVERAVGELVGMTAPQYPGMFPAESPETKFQLRRQERKARSHEQLQTPQRAVTLDDAQARMVRDEGLLGQLAVPALRFGEGWNENQRMKLFAEMGRARRLGLDVTPIQAKLEALGPSIPREYGEGGVVGFLGQAWHGAASTAAGLEAAPVAAVGAAGVAGLAVGIVTRNPAAAGAAARAAGATAGGLAGIVGSFNIVQGAAYEELLKVKGLPEAEAWGLSMLEASASTVVEFKLGLMPQLMMAAGFGRTEKAALGSAVRALAKDPALRSIAARFAAEYAKGVAGEVSEESVQQWLRQAVQYLGDWRGSGVAPTRPVADLAQTLGAGVEALPTALLLGVGTSGVKLFADLAQERVQTEQAAASAAIVTHLAELPRNSPTVGGVPREVAALIYQQTARAGLPVTEAHIDPAAFITLYQGKNEDAAKAAEELLGPGGPRQLQEALDTGGTLAVPLETYVAKLGGTDIARALADDTSVAANIQTKNRQKALAKEQKEALKAAAEQVAAELDGKADPTSRIVGELVAIEKELLAQGLDKKEVEGQIAPLRAVLTTQASRFNKSLDELFADVSFEAIRGDDGKMRVGGTRLEQPNEPRPAPPFMEGLERSKFLDQELDVVPLSRAALAAKVIDDSGAPVPLDHANIRRAVLREVRREEPYKTKDGASIVVGDPELEAMFPAFDVAVSGGGVRETEFHGPGATQESMLSLLALPEILANAVRVAEGPDVHGGENVEASRVFVAPLDIDGKPHTARLLVREIAERHGFYHLVALEEVKAPGSTQEVAEGQPATAHLPPLSETPGKRSLRRTLQHVNDEAGRPFSQWLAERLNQLPLLPGEKLGPLYHSAVAKAVVGAKQGKGDAKSWLAVISKTPGVKQEEIDALGLKEALELLQAQNKGALTREQVVAAIQAKFVELPPKETVLGGPESFGEVVGKYSDYLMDYGITHGPVDHGDFVLHFRTEDGRDLSEFKEILEYLKATDRIDTVGERGLRDAYGGLLSIAAKDPDFSPTQYGDYATKGSTPGTYRELLMYLPGGEGYRAPHFGQHGRGLGLHVRFSEHTLADGTNVLLVDEVQSDLHQEGREEGYAPLSAEREAIRKRYDDAYDAALNEASRFMPFGSTGTFLSDLADAQGVVFPGAMLDDAKAMAAVNEWRAASDAREDSRRAMRDGLPPNATHKATYEALAMKRLIRWAAENGYAKIAWTTGETQADRYNQALQQVETLRWYDEARTLEVVSPDGQTYTERDVSDERLREVLGPDLARRLTATDRLAPKVEKTADYEKRTGAAILADRASLGEWAVVDHDGLLFDTFATEEEARAVAAKDLPRPHVLGGLGGIKIGGRGMREAYDKRIPGIVSRMVKRHGGTVEKGRLQARADENKSRAARIGRFVRVRETRGGRWVAESESGEWMSEAHMSRGEAEAALARDREAYAGQEVWTATLPEALRAKVLKEGVPLFQDKGDDAVPRGYMTRERLDGRDLFKLARNTKADLSTFLHESGHTFLFLFNDLAARPDAPQSVKDDFAATLKWFGVDRWEDVKSEHHEKWAEAFERYLHEGKAPSAALARAFERMRLWLRDLYKMMTSRGADLNDEVRGVFDRMLATDAEIEEAKRAAGGFESSFKSAEEMGVAPEEYAKHLAEQAELASHARRAVAHRINKDRLREQEAWWKREEKALRRTAESTYDALPITQAKAALIGADIQPEGAATPAADEVAQLYGFGTGAQLLEAARAHPDRSTWSTAKAAEQMAAAHPDILAERTELRAMVNKGLHGDQTAKWLGRELSALHKKAGHEGAAPVDAIERMARSIVERRAVGRLPVGQALASERAAASNALKAATAGNYAQAYVFAQQRLLNAFIHRHLAEAREARGAFLERAKAADADTARARLGKAGPIYRDGVDMLLETLGLSEPLERETPLPSLAEMVQQMEADGASVLFDPAVVGRALARKDWKAVTVSELREVDGAMRSLQGAARTRATILMDGKRQDKAETVAALVAEGENLPDLGAVQNNDAKDWLDRRKSTVAGWDADILKPEVMVRWLGGDNLASTWFRAIILPFQAAKATEADLARKTIKPILEAFLAMPAQMLKRSTEAVDGKALFPGHITDLEVPTKRFELLAMALNAGNEGNLQRLLDGRRITPEQLAAALDLLTKEELDWVQTVWDSMESLWPLAADLEERLTGLRPPKVAARPVVTRHGTLRGGYYPAAYVRDVSNIGDIQEGSAIAALLDPSYARPGTSHGHLKSRARKVTAPIDLRLSVIPTHLSQAIHDVAFREAVMSVGSLIMDPLVKATLVRRLGPERARTFLQWVKDVGQMRGAGSLANAKGLTRTLLNARAKTTVAVLGFSLRTALGDFANLLAALPGSKWQLGVKSWLGGMLKFASAPWETRAFVLEKSGEMRTRQDQIQRELISQVKSLSQGKGRLQWVRDNAFLFQEWSDAATSTPLWLAAYNQALTDGKEDADAVIHADALIRRLFPSHSPVDASAVMRDKTAVGVLLMFHGYMNTSLNVRRDIAHDIHLAQGPGETAAAIGVALPTMLAFSATAMVAEQILSRLGPEEDEEWLEWFLIKLAIAQVQDIPFVGEVAGGVEAALRGKGTMERASPLVELAKNFGRAYQALQSDKKDDYDKASAMLQAAGVFMGLPTAAPKRAADYLHNVSTGALEVDSPLDVAKGLVYGEKLPKK